MSIPLFHFFGGFFFVFSTQSPFISYNLCICVCGFSPCETVNKYAKLLILSYLQVIIVLAMADCAVLALSTVFGHPLNKLRYGYNHSFGSGKKITIVPVTPYTIS